MAYRNPSDKEVVLRAIGDLAAQPPAYSHLQLTSLRSTGIASGYTSQRYRTQLQAIDRYVGRVLSTITSRPDLATSTLLVITSGSGGAAATSTSHVRHQVPLLVWAHGVQAGGDLYRMNPAWRDPGTARRGYAAPQPIFNAVVANLALGVLGIGPLPRGSINAQQAFTVFPAGWGRPPDRGATTRASRGCRRSRRGRGSAPARRAGSDEWPGRRTGPFVGGTPPRTRTENPVIKSHLLCQLS